MLLGFPLYRQDVQRLSAEIIEWVRTGQGARSLLCANPHSLEVAAENPAFSAALKQAGWLLPDGVGIVLASRLLGGSIRKRITGSDAFAAVNTALSRTGRHSVYLLGSTAETLEAIRLRYVRDFPGVRWAGSYSPPFSDSFTPEQTQQMIDAVNTSGADVLWVGMTAPKQELWIGDSLDRLCVRLAGAVGAVFGFYSGRVTRSSAVWQQVGLEWLPRLARDPRRLWRRTMVSAPRFLWRLCTERARRGE